MQAALDDIDKLPSSGKTSGYTTLLDATLSKAGPTLPRELISFIQAVISDNVGLVVSKQVVALFVNRMPDIQDANARKSVAEGALNALQSRQASFEEQTAALREILADILEQEEEWNGAAKMLQGINLDGSGRSVTDDYKLKMYVRIVRLLLEDEDTVSAQTFLSRAQSLIRTTNDQETILAFKLSQARVYDSQRKFQEAASKYHEISYVPEIDEGERLQILSAAVTCAILSPAGPRRSRLLATLYRDERSSQLSHYNILSAMYLDRIIKPQEVEDFAGMLAQHQKAKLGPSALIVVPGAEDEQHEEMSNDVAMDSIANAINGQPAPFKRKQGPEDVLDKAIMEHNLLSASLIYSNITFSGLGRLLSLTSSSAEAMARTMITQGRLKGASIDQVEGLITFERSDKDDKTETGSSNVAAAAAAAALSSEDAPEGMPPHVIAPERTRFDSRIRKVAQLAEDLAVRCASLMANHEGVRA